MEPIFYLIFLLIGFGLGFFTNYSRIEKTYKKIRQSIKPIKLGAIQRPTIEQLKKRGTAEEDEEIEMTELLRTRLPDA